MNKSAIATTADIERIVRDAMKENPEKTFTIRETADKLGRTYKQIWLRVKSGILPTTSDGKFITQESINHYLNRKNQ